MSSPTPAPPSNSLAPQACCKWPRLLLSAVVVAAGAVVGWQGYLWWTSSKAPVLPDSGVNAVPPSNTANDPLSDVPHGDWTVFDHTSAARKAAAQTSAEKRAALAAAEEAWVNKSVDLLMEEKRAESADGKPPRAEVLRLIEKDVLTLKSLDTSAERFKAVRKKLFDLAQATTEREIRTLLDAEQFDRAYGLARKHAVDWNATATILGASEVKKLDTLRVWCAYCAVWFKPAGPPPEPIDVAPPPRTRP